MGVRVKREMNLAGKFDRAFQFVCCAIVLKKKNIKIDMKNVYRDGVWEFRYDECIEKSRRIKGLPRVVGVSLFFIFR